MPISRVFLQDLLWLKILDTVMQRDWSGHVCKDDEIKEKKSPDTFDFIDVIHNLSGNWIHKALLIYINVIRGFQQCFRWYHPEQILPPYNMSHLHYVKRHLTRWLHTLFTRQIEPNDKGLGLQYITWESTAKKSSIQVVTIVRRWTLWINPCSEIFVLVSIFSVY